MINTLKIEFRRAFCNNTFKIVALIGVIVAVASFFIKDSWNICKFWLDYSMGKDVGVDVSSVGFMDTPLELWAPMFGVACKPYNTWLILAPLFCAAPYATTYFSDRQKGMINQLVMRAGKRNYYLSKLIVSFVNGGTIAVIPLIVNLLLLMCFLPWGIPVYSTHVYAVSQGSLFFEIFYRNPALYVVLYILTVFVLFGLINSVCVILAHVVENKYALMVSTFAIYYGEHAFVGFVFNNYRFSILKNARVAFTAVSDAGILLGIMAIFLIVDLLILIRVRKDVL